MVILLDPKKPSKDLDPIWVLMVILLDPKNPSKEPYLGTYGNPFRPL